MNTMMHKGYAARVEYSEDDECFVGHIAGIRDAVGFHGESVAELRAAFEEAVDDYLATCVKLLDVSAAIYGNRIPSFTSRPAKLTLPQKRSRRVVFNNLNIVCAAYC